MDTKLIQQWGQTILSYRLRTARQKERARYEDFYKELIQLDKEEKALYQQKQNLGWEPLVPPVQKGWKRLFVLRPDLACSKQADFYAGILAKINSVQWSHRKDFKVKKRAFGRKKYIVKEQYLQSPDEWQFQKLDFTEKEKAQFHEEWSYSKGKGQFTKRYVFNEPWSFVLKVQPNIISRVKKRDVALESRLQEIRDYLKRNAYDEIQIKLLRGNTYKYWKRGEKYNERNALRNKPLQRILDELSDQNFNGG